MVNVQKYQIVAIGDSVSQCQENYNELLLKNGVKEKKRTRVRKKKYPEKLQRLRRRFWMEIHIII